MATNWKVATTHNNTAGLANMSQKPAAPGGVQYPEVRWSANGTASGEGFAYCDLVWDVITRAMRGTLLTQFGLSDTTLSAAVTINMPNNANAQTNYNATAILLDSGRRRPGRWEGLTIRLNKLEAI